MTKKSTKEQRKIRHKRIRSRIKGTAERPRLFVFRSQKHLYATLVDDTTARVIASVSDLKLKKKQSQAESAQSMGKLLATAAIEKGISKAVFDRSGYKYHGNIKALAQGAREKGLAF